MSVQPTDERNQDGNGGPGQDTAPETPESDRPDEEIHQRCCQ